MEMPGEIGGYRLLEKLGSGGMGDVFLARDEQGRIVAVKTVRADLGDRPELRARLRREAATMARVQSPHVAELIHADIDGSVPYLVTRYVQGSSLSDVVHKRGPLKDTELWAIADGLAEAVDQIHQAGCLHRDIKPDNVIVADGRPVVIDFGISHAFDATRFTRKGNASGTSRYMAPELLLDGKVGPPADIFAWGATVAFTAIGRNPHWPHLRPDDIDDLLQDVLGATLRGPVIAALSHDPALRPSSTGLRAFFVRHQHIGRLLDEAERRVRSVPHLPARQVTAFVDISEAHTNHDPAKSLSHVDSWASFL
ncbi:serine/threonine-protein kinase [Actinomadura roseirufa]|uniref:serine/threonine-protein kinase n=1 Tax=Actinomadura roseirufa TaxID=2094049 RepID=UPI0010411309|nr:serine/threonine-protein kinase [Actinomadura roseirufa]